MSSLDIAQIVFFGAKVFFVLVIAGLALRFALSAIIFLIVAPTAFLLGLVFMALSAATSLPNLFIERLRAFRARPVQLPKNVLQFRRPEQASS